MSRARTSPFVGILFGLAVCAVIATNAVIVMREREAGDSLQVIRQHVSVAPGGSNEADRAKPESGALLDMLEGRARDTAVRLAVLRNAAPVGLLGKADARWRQLTERVSSLTRKMSELAMVPGAPSPEAVFEPRIIYAEYERVDELLEMSAPPNTLRNPATYTFTISYPRRIFPDKKIAEIKRGEKVGAYHLDAVNVETRQGPVVKDKIIRYRRRKGGVREPVWSYARLPSKQVVVLGFSAIADKSKHKLHYPASERGELSTLRREVPVGWIEIWETEEECSSRFPVMAGSELSWAGAVYRVQEVTPQELKLTELQSGDSSRWLLGGGP